MPSVARDTFSCDLCGLDGFPSFDEAFVHEQQCQQGAARKRQRAGSPGQASGMPPRSAAGSQAQMGGNYDASASPKLRRFTLMSRDDTYPPDMDGGDVLVCQNIEVFEAGPQIQTDSRGNEVPPEKLGIRCIHCVQQPSDQFNAYFPSSIHGMGEAVRILAKRHILECPATPTNVREALQRAFDNRRRTRDESGSSTEDERGRMALSSYCSMFCGEKYIVDRYPAQSGLVFAEGDPRALATPRHPYPQGYPTLGPEDETPYLPPTGPYGSFPPLFGGGIQPTPLGRTARDQGPSSGYGEREGGYSVYPPPFASGPRGMYAEGVHAPYGATHTGIEGMPRQHGPPHRETPGFTPYGAPSYGMSPPPYQSDFPFYQELSGVWSCKYCSSTPPQFRDVGSSWNSPDPPPPDFINQHLHVCRAYYQPSMAPSPDMYQGQPPPHHGYSPYRPPPPHYRGGIGTPGAPQVATHMHHQFSTAPHSVGRTPYQHPPSTQDEPPDRAPARSEAQGDQPAIVPASKKAQRAPAAARVPAPRQAQLSTGTGGEDSKFREAIVFLDTTDKNRVFSGESGSEVLVIEEDKMLLTDYFFYLMKQLRICRFTEADRKTRGGKRENIRVGYGGLQCVHCAEAPGGRKFYWSNVDRLANSFAEIPAHVLKCRHCPDPTKQAILQLKLRHSEQMSKLPRGSQKVFFRRMWRRVHQKADGEEQTETELEEHVPSVEPPLLPPAIETRVERNTRSPDSHRDRSASASSPGTSTDESALLFERPSEEAAKALAASLSPGHSNPPSPSSRVLLAIPEDKEWLSDMDCFVRRNLEVFCASQEDVETAQIDRKYPVSVGQVGIRCIHCALAKEGEGARGSAVAFPYSISGIYESVREFQRLHLETCNNLPAGTRQKLVGFQGSSSLSSVLRKYYVLAAKALGMYDTADGIRSGGEAVPLGPTAAFAFAEETSEASEEMQKGSFSPTDFAQTGSSITPLDSRKRRQRDEPEARGKATSEPDSHREEV